MNRKRLREIAEKADNGSEDNELNHAIQLAYREATHPDVILSLLDQLDEAENSITHDGIAYNYYEKWKDK